ncbi:hypothetical protein GCM10009745_80190 [Kribbella yunnanensis]|uniref:Uncharacterized protein n=1 Tax=Kribbella yunnanensis TaxID=190194 RepID=A0ABP4V9L0_9ACTN
MSRHQVGDLTVLKGTIAQTLLWQSPAFAQYGYRHSPEEVRDEPALEQVLGDVCVILDAAENRSSFAEDEAAALRGFIDETADNGQTVVVFFRGLDLSGTGGVWRSRVRGSAIAGQRDGWRQLGLEALSYLVLTATLVYLEFAPHLDWDHANYMD